SATSNARPCKKARGNSFSVARTFEPTRIYRNNSTKFCIRRMGLFDVLFGKKNADTAWQTPLVAEICILLVRSIPPHWNRVALILEAPEQGIGNGLSHSISSPEGHKDIVMPSMEVLAATRKLELGWVERKSTFKRAIISAQRVGENWSIKSEYEH